MVVTLLGALKGAVGDLFGKGEVMQDLEYAMLTKGNMTRLEEAKLRVFSTVARKSFIFGAGLYSFVGWFTFAIGHKFPGVFWLPRLHGLTRFCVVSVCGAFITGKFWYYVALRACAEFVLNNGTGEDRLKMELAKIILNKHTDDKPLVEAVQRHFFAEHLFNDQHQDRPLFRWHPRHSYVDNSFVERQKEIEDEVNSSNNEDRPISGQTTANIRSFGDLMDDPLACILGSPGSDMESHNLNDNTGTALKRREPRNPRRSQRHHHHHRNADKFAAF
ncbi:hypothetical protein ACP70R_019127 [Stipagrostis hirtigluma subsp. patula]